jgi:glutamyl-Q tRNA(Asp) synthetase
MSGTEEDVQPVFRFAPSPNGELHLGHAYSALLNHELARRMGGRLLLRIEDTDLERCRPEFEARIYEDLAWLGIAWEQPVWRQSEHFPGYAWALERLTELDVLYPCFASRKEIAEAATCTDPDGAPVYPGLYRDAPREQVETLIAAGTPYTLRLNIARALALVREEGGELLMFRAFEPATGGIAVCDAHPERWGDTVLARKWDGAPHASEEPRARYHLAVVVDDALQCVTHVVRGLDLEAAADLHCLLQALLGLPAPLYHHHRLITDAGGRKLSKRDKDKSLRALRAEGATPADIRRMLGF